MEAITERVSTAIGTLPLTSFSDEAFQNVWNDSDSLEGMISSHSVAVEEEHLDALTTIHSALNDWYEQSTPSSQGFFAWIHAAEWDIKAISLFLYRGVFSDKAEVTRACVSVYLTMLQSPDSKAFQGFHASIFRAMFKWWQTQQTSSAEKEGVLSDESVQALNTEVVNFLSTYSLHEVSESLDVVVDAVMSTATKDGARCDPYAMLFALIEPHQRSSRVEETIRVIFKAIVPVLTLSHLKAVTAQLKANALAPSNRALAFVKQCVTQLTDISRAIASCASTLMQHCVVHTAEKAEFRAQTCTIVKVIVESLPGFKAPGFVDFLVSLGKNSKAGYRHITLDVAWVMVGLMTSPDAKKEVPEANMEIVTDSINEISPKDTASVTSSDVKALLGVLMGRTNDRVATVRSRALACIAEALVSKNMSGLVQPLLDLGSAPVIGSPVAPISLKTVILRRCGDQRPVVRRSALACLEAYMFAVARQHEALVGVPDGSFANDPDFESVVGPMLSVFLKRTRDVGVMVRRQALDSLAVFTRHWRSSVMIAKTWFKGTISLVGDRENTVQSKAVSLITEFILTPITSKSANGSGSEMAWRLLDNLTVAEMRQLDPLGACLKNTDKLKPSMMTSVQSAITPSNALSFAGAWTLLDIFLTAKPDLVHKIDLNWLETCWTTTHQSFTSSLQPAMTRTAATMLRVITKCATEFDKQTGVEIVEQLGQLLSTFDLQADIVTAALHSLSAFRPAGSRGVPSWATPLAQKCVEGVCAALEPRTTQFSDAESRRIGNYLLTIGELVVLCPKVQSDRMASLIQAIISPEALKAALPPFRPGTPPTQAGGPIDISIPDDVTAIAFVALGRLCLNNTGLAKRCVPMFAHEVHTHSVPAVRNNILLVLSDLCMRYSAVVDEYVPSIALAMRDANVLVRRQAVSTLARLIQEDFVKWKEGLFHFFCVTLVDESDSVNSIARYFVRNNISVKNHTQILNSFIEHVFFLNAFTEHAVYNRFSHVAKARELFDLSGSSNRDLRMKIYAELMGTLTDEQKFTLTGNLCEKVLGAVVDTKDGMTIDNAGEVLEDTLMILMSDDIKINTRRTDESAEGAVDAAKGKLMSSIVKKAVIEMAVPILVQLRHMLEQAHSPLLRPLVAYFKFITKAFDKEMQEVLTGNPRLAKEIEFDLRQEAAEASTPSKRRQAESAALRSPHPFNANHVPDGVRVNMTPSSPLPDTVRFAVPKLRRGADGSKQSVVPSPRKIGGIAGTPVKMSGVTPVKSRKGAHITMFSPENMPPNKQWGIKTPAQVAGKKRSRLSRSPTNAADGPAAAAVGSPMTPAQPPTSRARHVSPQN